MKLIQTLDGVFNFLDKSANYKESIKKRVIKIILSNSVIRVFAEGSKEVLSDCLSKIDVDKLQGFQSEKQYDKWHHQNVNKLYKCLAKNPNHIKRLGGIEGLKWGHSSKIFNLFIGHLVNMSPYFERKNAMKIMYFLHVPLDSKVFGVLRNCDLPNVPNLIKDVNQKSYKKIQIDIRTAASKYKQPAIFFDEYAWAFN